VFCGCGCGWDCPSPAPDFSRGSLSTLRPTTFLAILAILCSSFSSCSSISSSWANCFISDSTSISNCSTRIYDWHTLVYKYIRILLIKHITFALCMELRVRWRCKSRRDAFSCEILSTIDEELVGQTSSPSSRGI
jgi:hypothetical protein